MKKTLTKTISAGFGTLALLFAFASCDSLQDELSSEQLKDQAAGIGSVSAESTVFYYNESKDKSVKGSNERWLTLNLSQIANADKASVKYALEYTIGDIVYKSEGSGSGQLSDSKTKYYVDLSPAINLIDGTGSPSSDDISLSVTVSGLTNESGNDYDGRSFPTFTKTIKFAPLYNAEIEPFSTKSAPAGTTFEIPLNGKITAIDEAVTATKTDGDDIPEGAEFTASVSDDGTKIILTSSNELTGSDFTADFAFTGIKPVGGKESYKHTFKDVSFSPTTVKLDGKLDEDAWKAESVATSTDSYSETNTYQNMKTVYVTNDSLNLYVAVEFAEAVVGNKTAIQLSFDTPSSGDVTSDSAEWPSSTEGGIAVATSTTFQNGELDFKAWENISWGKDGTEAEGHHEVKNLKSSATYPEWSDAGNGYQCGSKIIEYAISLSDLSVSSGDKVKLLVSISNYEWTDAAHETLLDCIPSAAATVESGAETVTVDFSKALEYTIQ